MTGIQIAWSASGTVLEPTVSGGHLALGDVLEQNQALILMLHRGELKERPAVGVGISDMLLDNDPIYWRTQIREQLEMDGQTVGSIVLTSTDITIESTY
jgi:hypothetical protein